MLVSTFTSQPSSVAPGCGPLQSRNDPVHVYVQSPAAQVRAELFALEQGAAHAPQCETFVARFTSQPLAAFPSQSAKPGLQVIPQVPPEQIAVPLVELQTLLHEPHRVGSMRVFTSQPSSVAPGVGPLQSAKPPVHV